MPESDPIDPDLDDVWELGVTRIFGMHDIAPSALISGWAQPEDQHVWTNGLEAVLRICIPNPGRQIGLSLECKPFLSETCPLQEVTLFANGIHAQFWRLTEPQIYVLDASLSPRHLKMRGNHAILSCAWLLPYCARPAVTGHGQDMRELGLCFRAMTIS